MSRMGRAVIGIGIGEGENRAVDAIQKAIMSPLLEHNSLKGARSILLNISGDASLSLHEMNIIAGYVHDEVHPEAHIIVGSTILIHEKKDSISVTIIATGFEDQLKSRLHNKNILHTNTSHQSQFGFSQNNPMNNYSATPKQYYGSVHNTNNQPNFGFGSGHTLHEKIQNENNQRSNEKFTSNSNIDVPTFLRNQSIEK
jgi:cell division GTPase FtsZ